MHRLITIILVFTFSWSSAQHWTFLRNEVSFGLGTTSFLGDLGGANKEGSHGIKGFLDFDFKVTRPIVQVGFRHFFSQKFAGKVNLSYARLSGNDALTTEQYRQNRNLHFRSPLIELEGQIEFYPWGENFGHMYRSNGVKGEKSSKLSPYIFVGIGGGWFNPKAKYNGNWTALQPLKTEGVDYKKIMGVFPFGIGLKYALDKHWSIGLELTLRYTTTDYLDDVSDVYVDHSNSDAKTQKLADPNIGLIDTFVDGTYVYDPTAPGQQRGDVSYNDAYAFAIFSINYKLLKGRRNLPKF